jgi:hypothetical protein
LDVDASVAGNRYLGSPFVSSLAALSACSWVSSPAFSIIWSRSWTVIERDAFAALRILTAAGTDFGPVFFDIFRLLAGIYEPTPQDAIGIAHEELDERVVFDPAMVPKASSTARPHVDASAGIDPGRFTELVVLLLDRSVGVFKDGLVEILVAPLIGQRFQPGQSSRLDEIVMEGSQVASVVRVQEIEAEPQTDHRGDHGGRLLPPPVPSPQRL